MSKEAFAFETQTGAQLYRLRKAYEAYLAAPPGSCLDYPPSVEEAALLMIREPIYEKFLALKIKNHQNATVPVLRTDGTISTNDDHARSRYAQQLLGTIQAARGSPLGAVLGATWSWLNPSDLDRAISIATLGNALTDVVGAHTGGRDAVRQLQRRLGNDALVMRYGLEPNEPRDTPLGTDSFVSTPHVGDRGGPTPSPTYTKTEAEGLIGERAGLGENERPPTGSEMAPLHEKESTFHTVANFTTEDGREVFVPDAADSVAPGSQPGSGDNTAEPTTSHGFHPFTNFTTEDGREIFVSAFEEIAPPGSHPGPVCTTLNVETDHHSYPVANFTAHDGSDVFVPAAGEGGEIVSQPASDTTTPEPNTDHGSQPMPNAPTEHWDEK